MAFALLFWFGLIFAGAVVVRRWSPETFEGGPLAVIGLGTVAAFAVLSPVSILCYLLRLPVLTLSIACILFVLWAIYYAVRKRYWTDFRGLLIGALCVEMGVVVFDMWTGACVGASTGGDASVHLARIRFLLDHGFSNQDPYIEAPAFFSIYNTNLIHALYAAGTRICGVDHLGAWVASLSWAKLLTASGAYFASWSIFGRRWPAYFSAVFVLMLVATIPYVNYPNQLCVNWMLPMMLGLVVRVCAKPTTPSSVIALGAGALVLGQCHGLYVAFVLLGLGPVLTAVVAYRHIKKSPDRWVITLALGAILLGTPFPAAAKLADKPAALNDSSTQVTSEAADSVEEKAAARYIEFGNGWKMYNPKLIFSEKPVLVLVLATIGIVCSVLGPRRNEALIAIAALGTTSIILFLPPVCTLVLKFLGKMWILGRFESSLHVYLWSVVPGSVALLLEPKIERWRLRWFLSLLVAFAGAHFYARTGAYAWATYWESVQKRGFLSDEGIQFLRNNRAILKEAVPGGAVVLTEPRVGRFIVTIYDCHILAPDRGSPGVSANPQRRIDHEAMLSPQTGWPERKALLDQYGIRFFLITRATQNSTGWLSGRLVNKWNYGGGILVEFRTD